MLKVKVVSSAISHYPKVSVLVAARNEEKNIERCIEYLLALDYPKDKLQILIGDDQSDDRTFEIANRYAEENPILFVKEITQNIGHLRGKANVLAHLANEAEGDYFFITDADTAVPTTWISGMLAVAGKNIGIVTGVTAIENSTFQNLDWIFALGMVKVISELNQPVTAMGNNMYVTRKAYGEVGGYQAIPFSITEDYELFRQVRKLGFDTVQLFQPEIMAYSKPVYGIWKMLHQRKRWMMGAVQLPWPVVLLLCFQALYYPFIIILLIINFKIGLAVLFVKILIQSIFIAVAENRLNKRFDIVSLIGYELYAAGLSILSLLFYLLPIKTVWKGRKY